jgi:hypothetical protein
MVEVRIKTTTQLHGATASVNTVKTQLDSTLNGQFTKIQAPDPKPACADHSPEFSFMRAYDCETSSSVKYISKEPMTKDEVSGAVDTFLAQIHAGTTYTSDGTKSYASLMDAVGSWHDSYSIPDSGVSGVSQTNYAGGQGLANVHIEINAAYSASEPGKTELSFLIGQKYATCQSFFFPCNDPIAK